MATATVLGLAVALVMTPQGDERLVVEGPQPAVVRLGASAQVLLRVDTRKNPPAPVVPRVTGLRIRVIDGGTQESRSFVNGRQTFRRSLKYVLDIHPLRAGKFTIPAFDVDLGTSKQKTKPIQIEAQKDIVGEKYAYLEVTASRKRVYLHEPIRFRLDYGVDKRLQLANQRVGRRVVPGVVLHAPWLSRIDGLEPIQEPELKEAVVLGLNDEPVAVQYDPNHQRGSQTYNGFRLARSFLPTRAGAFQLEAPVLGYSIVKQKGGLNRRFGFPFEREQAQTLYVYGKPIAFEVVDLPGQGRPAVFYNAVGRFQVDAALDKQKVMVGDSIKLTLTIAGSGNMEFLEFPELKDLPGFHTLGKIEKRDQEKVVVTYDLTPKTVTIKAVPAIEWNYFDTTPGVERYQTVNTDPLPLTVEPLEGRATLAPLPNSDDKTVEMGVDDIYDMKPGAGSTPLLLPAPPSPVTGLLAGLLPWLLLASTALLWTWVRRRRADVAGQRARGAVRRFQRALLDGTDPHTALVEYLADRLACEPAAVIGEDLGRRLEAAGVEPDLSDTVGRQVEAGVSARYAGADATSAADANSVRDLVQRLEGMAIKPLLVALGLCLLLGSLAAQEPQANGEGAYRRGDYDAATALFKERAATGDRRAAYNLGNSLYRQGRFAEALAAYERARLATPRDAQLLFNIRLTRQKLDLVEGEGELFLETLAELRDRLTPWERLWLCSVLNLFAAGLVLLGGRRLRAVGLVLALPALLVLLEVSWWGPARPQKGIVTVPKVKLRSEPRVALEALMTLRAGVAVAVLQEGPAWTRVRLRDREGYLPNDSLQVVR